MVSNIYSMALEGTEAFKVKIESDVSQGMPMCDIVGLPDIAVKEAKNRVRAAIKNCGFTFPLARITINLAPANIRKSGSLYDLPIFLSILHASGQLITRLDNSIFIGELSLSGDVRPVNGVLSMALKAKKEGFKNIFLPKENAAEAAVINGINVYPLKNVSELTNFLIKKTPMDIQPPTIISKNFDIDLLDFSQVKGQYSVKRALEITAAGGHNILMIGPPGCGKSMLAKRMPSILPEMTFEEMVETTQIYSVTGMLGSKNPLITERPFRAPHHSISMAGLTGGGSIPKPGEISLAHNGVIFLDELSEFSKPTMESLRQPLEDGTITISRAKNNFTFPCSLMVVAAMNPCPCGYRGHPTKSCTCSRYAIEKHMAKISGPILDRIDIHIEVPPVDFDKLRSNEKSESSHEVRRRVNNARKIQHARYMNETGALFCNAKIPSHALREICPLTSQAQNLLKKAFEMLDLSARGYNKILKISRTIADLEKCETIDISHVSEAIQYRSLDRKYALK